MNLCVAIIRRYACDYPWSWHSSGSSGLGDFDRAFDALEQARRDGDMWVTENNADLIFEPLHTDPRWGKLLERMGIQ